MEIIAGLIAALALWSSTVEKEQQPVPPSEIEQCAKACNTGTVKQYRWCKCHGPLWEK